MKKEKESEGGYTQREIAVALNNAVVATLRPKVGAISADRMANLREYALAIIAPLLEHLEEPDLLLPEELTAILAAAAMTIHCAKVMNGSRLPAGIATDHLFTR